MKEAYNLQSLYEKYLDLVRFEISEFSVKPTEVRHLIGRLGEFFCAIVLDGVLASTPNQHGFDVVCKKGRKVSVKTTAQKSGFVAIGGNTLSLVDDLMIIQFIDDSLRIVYYGPIELAVAKARYYDDIKKYELDISAARLIYKDIDSSLDLSVLNSRAHILSAEGRYFEFKNDDDYLKWISEHLASGYILNCNKSHSQSSVKIHRANCRHITELRGNAGSGGFTRDYIKVGAFGEAALRNWLALRRGDVVAELCGNCLKAVRE
ncbi:hypothetical protein [Chitinimonas sp.]|uniref:DUF6998 domain-containing protein n=1 Tax=Chitinimonas sp. TaxID=1934313 RepID=UPI0035ADCE0C